MNKVIKNFFLLVKTDLWDSFLEYKPSSKFNKISLFSPSLQQEGSLFLLPICFPRLFQIKYFLIYMYISISLRYDDKFVKCGHPLNIK